MIDELASPLVQSVGNKGKTKLMDINTIDNNLQDSVSDKDEYDMGASNCAAAAVVYVVVYVVVYEVYVYAK